MGRGGSDFILRFRMKLSCRCNKILNMAYSFASPAFSHLTLPISLWIPSTIFLQFLKCLLPTTCMYSMFLTYSRLSSLPPLLTILFYYLIHQSKFHYYFIKKTSLTFQTKMYSLLVTFVLPYTLKNRLHWDIIYIQ